MIVLLSPSKTLDLESKIKTSSASIPEFLDFSKELIKEFKNYSSKDLAKLMKISENLANLNYDRFQNFNKQKDRQALFTFKGDVYKDIEIENYSQKDLDFAQKTIRILSGLYGILKPLDLIRPYRLEMHLKTPYWKNKIYKSLNSKEIINLASNEYFSAVDTNKVNAKIYQIFFKEKKGDQFKIVAIYAKRARGSMANFIIKNKITKPEELKKFNEKNYKFNKKLSSENEFVFTR